MEERNSRGALSVYRCGDIRDKGDSEPRDISIQALQSVERVGNSPLKTSRNRSE